VADLASLLKRSERVRAAIAALQAAASDAALPVDTALLASIKDQHRTVELARARLEATVRSSAWRRSRISPPSLTGSR
jgi:hypothetical protein